MNESLTKKAIPILKNEGVTKAALFGSFTRGKAKKSSDIDILIEFKGKKNLFHLIDLKYKLENVFGRKVDILTYKSINHLLKDTILNEQEVFYEERS